MTTRELPAAEWGKLAGTELEAVAPLLDPENTRIVVVEDGDGAVIGCWGVLRFVHVEGVWIAPAHRKRGRVAARLLRGMQGAARAWGARNVWTGSLSDEVTGLLTRHLKATKLPGDHFAVPIGEP